MTNHSENYEQERRRKTNVEYLDRSPSSGSVGSEQKPFDESAPTMHDGRALTRTKFYADEADNDHINYEKLAKINDGMFASDDDKRSHEAGREIDVEMFTDHVDFDWKQKDAVRRILDDVDNVSAYQSAEILILAIITIVANRNNWMIRRNNHEYNELREICNVDKKQVRQARQKLRENVLD